MLIEQNNCTNNIILYYSLICGRYRKGVLYKMQKISSITSESVDSFVQ